MSNQAVGAVYQIIIDEVINTSRVDFEESGVEEHVLEELRQMRGFDAASAVLPSMRSNRLRRRGRPEMRREAGGGEGK
ncbi:hypothetical protein E4U39_002358 [Claviceps sp. Clav50 group G5]|nr:hypothetical protein E4U39_002358 [Claviceps sp. Clav50 group G5]